MKRSLKKFPDGSTVSSKKKMSIDEFNKKYKTNYKNKYDFTGVTDKETIDFFEEINALDKPTSAALYKEHLAYGKPKVTKKRNPLPLYNTGNASYNPFNNTIYLHNDTEVEGNVSDEEKKQFRTQNNINKYISELAHSAQNHSSDGLSTKFITNDIPAWIKSGNSYNTKGTAENQAHNVIEPYIKKDFKRKVQEYGGFAEGGTISIKQEQMKKGKRSFKNGGVVRYDMGGPVKDVTSSSLNLIVPGLGTALSAADSLATNPDGSPKDNKVAQIASRTNPLTNIGRIADGKDVGRSLLGLTGIGGLAEVTGLNDKLFGESDYDIAARKAKELEDSKNKTVVRMGQANTATLGITGTNNNMYPHGGVVQTDQPGAIAELELQEQMQLPNGTVMGVDGPSHENGGIEVNVPEGTRVFSDRLKLEGKTFAKHAKSLNNKISKLDKRPDSTAKSNTEMLINKQLDNLFNTQEEMKTIKAQKKMFAKGGVIPAHNVRLMPDGGTFWGNAFAKGAQSVYGDMGNSMLSGSVSDGVSANEGFNFKMSPQNSAFATQVLSNLVQNQQINSVKAPRTIKSVNFTAGQRPDKVSYSAERAAVDSEVAGARAGLKLGSGSYSTQAANLQKIRNQQLMAKGRSFQTEKNTNTQLDNAYKAQQAAAYNQAVQANLGIDQYNLENAQNYALWKAGQRMKSTGSTADTMTNVFNNQTAYQNQMNYWDVMKQMYEPKVAEDIKIKKKLGGTVKRMKK